MVMRLMKNTYSSLEMNGVINPMEHAEAGYE